MGSVNQITNGSNSDLTCFEVTEDDGTTKYVHETSKGKFEVYGTKDLGDIEDSLDLIRTEKKISIDANGVKLHDRSGSAGPSGPSHTNVLLAQAGRPIPSGPSIPSDNPETKFRNAVKYLSENKYLNEGVNWSQDDFNKLASNAWNNKPVSEAAAIIGDAKNKDFFVKVDSVKGGNVDGVISITDVNTYLATPNADTSGSTAPILGPDTAMPAPGTEQKYRVQHGVITGTNPPQPNYIPATVKVAQNGDVTVSGTDASAGFVMGTMSANDAKDKKPADLVDYVQKNGAMFDPITKAPKKPVVIPAELPAASSGSVPTTASTPPAQITSETTALPATVGVKHTYGEAVVERTGLDPATYTITPKGGQPITGVQGSVSYKNDTNAEPPNGHTFIYSDGSVGRKDDSGTITMYANGGTNTSPNNVSHTMAGMRTSITTANAPTNLFKDIPVLKAEDLDDGRQHGTGNKSVNDSMEGNKPYIVYNTDGTKLVMTETSEGKTDVRKYDAQNQQIGAERVFSNTRWNNIRDFDYAKKD